MKLKSIVIFVFMLLISYIYYKYVYDLSSFQRMIFCLVFTVLSLYNIYEMHRLNYSNRIKNILKVVLCISVLFVAVNVSLMFVMNYKLIETHSPITTWNNKYKKMEDVVEGTIIYDENNSDDSNVAENLQKSYGKEIVLADRFDAGEFKYYVFYTNRFDFISEKYDIHLAKVSNDADIVKVSDLTSYEGVTYLFADFGGYDSENFYLVRYAANDDFTITPFDYDLNALDAVSFPYETAVDASVINKEVFLLDYEGNIITYDIKGNKVGVIQSGAQDEPSSTPLFQDMIFSDNKFYINNIYSDINEVDYIRKIAIYDQDNNSINSILYEDKSNRSDVYSINKNDDNYDIKTLKGNYVVKELGYDMYYNINKDKILSDSYDVNDESGIDNRFQSNILFTILLTLLFPIASVNVIIRLIYIIFRNKKSGTQPLS